MSCLPCALKNYDVVCYRCGKGYCHPCFLKADTGGLTCDGRLTLVEWDPEALSLHSYKYLRPEWSNDGMA